MYANNSNHAKYSLQDWFNTQGITCEDLKLLQYVAEHYNKSQIRLYRASQANIEGDFLKSAEIIEPLLKQSLTYSEATLNQTAPPRYNPEC